MLGKIRRNWGLGARWWGDSMFLGGEKQRVALALALINDPTIIMGDEPTGNLDKKNSDIVFEIFEQLCEEYRQKLLIVTHDSTFSENTHRVIRMQDGRVVDAKRG
jgi:lipoprotein-releasing system ATP-binding protein